VHGRGAGLGTVLHATHAARAAMVVDLVLYVVRIYSTKSDPGSG